MRPKIVYLDCCLPDYFQGFSGTVFAVPVTGSDRVWQVRDALLHEIDAWDGFVPEGYQIPDDCDIEQAAKDAFEKGNFHVCFPDLPRAWEYEDGDTPVAYFGLKWGEE